MGRIEIEAVWIDARPHYLSPGLSLVSSFVGMESATRPELVAVNVSPDGTQTDLFSEFFMQFSTDPIEMLGTFDRESGLKALGKLSARLIAHGYQIEGAPGAFWFQRFYFRPSIEPNEPLLRNPRLQALLDDCVREVSNGHCQACRAYVQYHRGRLESAYRDADAVLQRFPTNLLALTVRAISGRGLGEERSDRTFLDRAWADITRAVEIDPQYAYAAIIREDWPRN